MMTFATLTRKIRAIFAATPFAAYAAAFAVTPPLVDITISPAIRQRWLTPYAAIAASPRLFALSPSLRLIFGFDVMFFFRDAATYAI